MSGSLIKTIVLGNPSSGKTFFLKNADISFFYWKNFVSSSLEETIERSKSEILKRLNRSKLFFDEPFYFMPIFLYQDLWSELNKKKYIIASHKWAYFFSEPNLKIVLLKNKEPCIISSEKFCETIHKPSLDFYIKDIKDFASFFNEFNDVNLTKEDVETVVENPLLREIRTSYIVRDFMLSYCLGIGFDEYFKRIRLFFKKRWNFIPEVNKEIIRKQFYPFEVDFNSSINE